MSREDRRPEGRPTRADAIVGLKADPQGLCHVGLKADPQGLCHVGLKADPQGLCRVGLKADPQGLPPCRA